MGASVGAVLVGGEEVEVLQEVCNLRRYAPRRVLRYHIEHIDADRGLRAALPDGNPSQEGPVPIPHMEGAVKYGRLAPLRCRQGGNNQILAS